MTDGCSPRSGAAHGRMPHGLRLWIVGACVVLASLCSGPPAWAQTEPSGPPPPLRPAIEAGLVVIRHADTGEPLSTLRLSGEPRALCAVGTVLFVARSGRGVALVDLRDPRAPREVTTFAHELLVGQLKASGDVLQLRSPSGDTTASYRIRGPHPPRLLRRVQARDEDAEPDADEGEGESEGEGRDGSDNANRGRSGDIRPNPSGGPAVPANWLALRLRDGRRELGRPLPTSDSEYLVLRLANRATLTVLRSEIATMDVAPPPGADAAEPPRAPAASAAAASPPQFASSDPIIVGERRYRIDGVTFKIWRSRDGLGQRLGETRLPWSSPQAPIVRGRAAYVWLPHRGLAVVDIGLSRFPYVVWQLLPQHAVQRARLEGDRLHIKTDRGAFEYDLTDPLDPKGPERYPYAPRRLYPAAAEPISDGTWQDLGVLAPTTGRRIYLHDGNTVVGTWIRTTHEGITLDILGQPRTLARSDVLHSEPVELQLEMPPPPKTPPAKSSPPTPGRILLITGATIIAISQILAFTAIIVMVVVIPAVGFRVPTGVSATEPAPGSLLHPPIVAPQQLPWQTSRPLLNIRF